MEFTNPFATDYRDKNLKNVCNRVSDLIAALLRVRTRYNNYTPDIYYYIN